MLLAAVPVFAQDLDPRAYAESPDQLHGGDHRLRLLERFGADRPDASGPGRQGQHQHPVSGRARVFNLFGKTAQALAALPYSWAEVTGEINEQAARTTRSGLSDMRLRLSVLVAGAPAVTLQQLAKSPRKPVIGASLLVTAPTGRTYPQKFINLGANRWGFKPEIALSSTHRQPVARRRLRRRLDVHRERFLLSWHREPEAGPGRRAAGTPQLLVHPEDLDRARRDHLPGRAGDGERSQGGDRLTSTRIGATLAFSVGSRHSIKIAYSTGAIVRFGANFDTFSIGWQTAWIDRRMLKR